MDLWTTNVEDTKVTMPTITKEKINKSGVYELKIKEAYITNSTRSKAVACTINANNEGQYVVFNLWFKKGDGTENESSKRLLNRLMFLCKLKSSDLKVESTETIGSNGEKKTRNTIKAFSGKEIGMILELRPSEYTLGYMDVNVKDFFDIKTQKTCSEIQNNEEALYVSTFRQKYKTVSENVEQTNNDNQKDKDDEFPF